MERTLSKGSGETNMWTEHYPKEVGKLTLWKEHYPIEVGELTCGKNITQKYIGVCLKHPFASNANANA